MSFRLSMFKKFFSQIVVLSLVLTMVPARSVFAVDIEGFITDSALRTCIEEALSKNPGDPISDIEASGLGALICNSKGITNLAGLEYFTGLWNLSLAGNAITDLTPISGLSVLSLQLQQNQLTGSDLSSLSGYSSINMLFLWGNEIEDVSNLAGMSIFNLNLGRNLLTDEDVYSIAGISGLEMLSLDNNGIVDISGLSSLSGLTWLNLEENQIVNIAALSGLTSLNSLYLRNNQIIDIQPLIDNSGIIAGDNVDLRWNPLNSYVDVMALVSNGAVISYNYVCGDPLMTVTSPEECDDGNNDNGDGCSDVCTIEGVVAPSTCQEVTKGTDFVEIGWIDNSSNETAFEIQQSVNATDYTVVDDAILPETVDYTISPLTSGEKYWFRIRALNGGEQSSWLLCNPVETYVPPLAPSNLDDTNVYGNFMGVTWTNNSENVDNFVLEMSTDGLDYDEVDHTIASEWRGYGVDDLTENTQYWFRVKAVNEYGDSDYATLGPITTLGAEEVPLYLFGTKWTKEWQKSQNGVTYGVVLDDLGNIYTSENGWVVKRDANGNYVDYFVTGGSESTRIYDGDLYVPGTGTEIYDTNGNLQNTVIGSGYYSGVARDTSGNVYLADSANGEIDKYDSGNNFLMSFGSGELSSSGVHDIDIDSGDVIYVADVEYNAGILKFDQSGNYLGDFVTIGGGWNNQGIFIDDDGNVYTSGDGNVYTSGDGGTIKKYSSAGDILLSFNTSTWARDVYADDNYIYVAGAGQLLKYDMSGDLVDEYVGEVPIGQIAEAYDIDIGPSGIVYVADVEHDTGILKFDRTGDYLGDFVTIGGGWNNQGIFIDDDGNVYTVGDGGDVRKYNSSGDLLLHFNAGTWTRDIYVDDTYIYVGGADSVLKYDMSGNLINEYSQSTVVYGIVVDADSNIYLSQNTDIKKLDSGGNLLTTWGVSGYISKLDIDDEYLYVSGGSMDVAVYDFVGNLIDTVEVPEDSDGVAKDSDGYLFVAGQRSIYKYSSYHVCGNGLLEAPETCDDGNTVSFDGCSAACTIEQSIVISVCGDGIVSGAEECDDGNLINGDGCSSLCIEEEVDRGGGGGNNRDNEDEENDDEDIDVDQGDNADTNNQDEGGETPLINTPITVVPEEDEVEVTTEEELIVESIIPAQENAYDFETLLEMMDAVNNSESLANFDLDLIDSREMYTNPDYERLALALVTNSSENCVGENSMNCLKMIYGRDVQGLSEKEVGDAIVFQWLGEEILDPKITNLGGTTGSSPAILVLSQPNDHLAIDITAEIEKNGVAQSVPVMILEGDSDEEGKAVIDVTPSLLDGEYKARVRAIRDGEQIIGNEKLFTVEGSIDGNFYVSGLSVEEDETLDIDNLEVSEFVNDLLFYVEKFEPKFKVEKYVAYLKDEGKRYIVTGKVNLTEGEDNPVVYLAYKSVTFGSAVIADASQGGTFKTVVSKELPKSLHVLNVYAYDPKKNQSTSLKKITFNTK